MTIHRAINILDTNDIRLTFGVPLEDIFPQGNIHPSLHNLFVEIFKSIKGSQIPIQNILSNEKPTSDHIFLEEAVMLSEPIDFMTTDTLIWMLRHFLGMLPLPLLPKYTDGTKYVWLELSEICKSSIETYIKDRKNNECLVDKLSTELLSLPSVNLLLIGYLINFLRSLTVQPGRRQRINKTSAFALVRYFSSSLFIRPYHSGYYSKKENLYHPLMLYLIIKWPEIQKMCMEKHPLCFIPVQRAKKVHNCTNLCEVTCKQKANVKSNENFVKELKTVLSGSCVNKSKTADSINENATFCKCVASLNNDHYSKTLKIQQEESPLKGLKNNIGNTSSQISKTQLKVVCPEVDIEIDAVPPTINNIECDVSSDISLNTYIGSSYTSHEVICNSIRYQSEYSESTDSYVTLPDIDFLKDSCCQTDLSLLKSSIRKCCDNCMNYKEKRNKFKSLNKNKSTVQTQTISEDIYNISKPIGEYRSYQQLTLDYPKYTRSKARTVQNKRHLFSPQSYYDAQEYIYDEYEECVNIPKNISLPPDTKSMSEAPSKSKSVISLKFQEGLQYINSAIVKSASATVEFIKKSNADTKSSCKPTVPLEYKSQFETHTSLKSNRKQDFPTEFKCNDIIRDYSINHDQNNHSINYLQEQKHEPLRTQSDSKCVGLVNDKLNLKKDYSRRSLQVDKKESIRLEDSLSCGHEKCLENMVRTNNIGNLKNGKQSSIYDEDYISDTKQIYLKNYYSDGSKIESDTMLNVDRSDSEITEKITKIGWNYKESANIDDIKDTTTIADIHNNEMGWIMSKENCESSRNNKEFKPNKNISTNLISYSKIYIENPEEIGNAKTLLDTKAKKSLISFSKMKSKMDFTKLFRDRKMINSPSAEQIGCKIKYEKIGAAKSNIF